MEEVAVTVASLQLLPSPDNDDSASLLLGLSLPWPLSLPDDMMDAIGIPIATDDWIPQRRVNAAFT